MRPTRSLTACLAILMSMLLAGEALAQRAGGGGGTGGAGGMRQGGAGSTGGARQGGAQQGTRQPTDRTNQRSRLQQNPQQTAAADIRARIEARNYTFEETGEKLPYAVFVPRKYNKKRPMPLVVALHGRDSAPESIVQALGAAAEKYGYIIVAPLGYTKSGWYGYGQYVEGFTDPEESRLSELDVMAVLDIARTEFNVDPRRIYVAGHSMGGLGAVYLAAKYPDIFAAVGAMSPALTNQVPEEIAEFDVAPIVIEHGDKDEIIPIDLVRAWVDGLKKLKAEMKYYEYRNGTHLTTLQGGADRVFEYFGKHKRAEDAPPVAKK